MIAIEVIAADGSVVEKRTYPAAQRQAAQQWMKRLLERSHGLMTMWAEDDVDQELQDVGAQPVEAA